MVKFGCLGVGHMGLALAQAVAKAVGPRQVMVSSRTREKAEAVAAQLGCAAGENRDLAAQCEYLLLGVKPQVMPGVLEDLAPAFQARSAPCVLVSMAAGISLAQLHTLAPGCPAVRIMPNTPVSVGAGLVLYAPDERVTPEQESELAAALTQAGRVDCLPEALLDAAGAVAGCGPAFACLFLEALADGGVACGLPRRKAYEYGAQMLLGTASLFLATGDHPGVLKDGVCSPGGSTVQGVRVLEERGLRGAVIDAVLAAWERSGRLGKPVL